MTTKREHLIALVEERAGLQRRLTEIDAEIDELFEERGTRPGRRPTKRKDDSRGLRALKPADLVHCTRCGLRGHTAGDPDRCLYYHGSLGLGGQADQARRAG